MAAPSSTRLLVLHALRVKGLGEAPAGGEPELERLAADGLVQRRDGQVSGWRLTPAGRTEHERLMSGEIGAGGVRLAVEGAYRVFATMNQDFLRLCTDAQLQSPAADGDPTDGALFARLEAMHARLLPVLTTLTAALARFGAYRGRFETALALVRAGERDYLTRPLVDSYHTIWSELHEDLLATLGIARGSETEWLASAK